MTFLRPKTLLAVTLQRCPRLRKVSVISRHLNHDGYLPLDWLTQDE